MAGVTIEATAGMEVVIVVVVFFVISFIAALVTLLVKILSKFVDGANLVVVVDNDLESPEEAVAAADAAADAAGDAVAPVEVGVSPKAASVEALDAAVAVGATAVITTLPPPPLSATFGGDPTAVAV